MAQLLIVLIWKKSETRKSFSNMITVIRLHLMTYLSFMEFINDTLQGMAKVVRYANGLFALILRGRATLDLQQVFFRLKPNIDLSFRVF
jgi:hypothetical protein